MARCDELLSPYDYWQFWRNAADADVGKFLRLFTDLPLDEIARLESAAGRRDQPGQDRARDRSDGDAPRARGGARRPRRPRRRPSPAAALGEDLPTLIVGDGMSIARRADRRSASRASNGEAKRKIAEGAVRLDDVTVNDPGTDARGRR